MSGALEDWGGHGKRQRKKRVRFGEESDEENQPPSNVPRLDGDAMIKQAEELLGGMGMLKPATQVEQDVKPHLKPKTRALEPIDISDNDEPQRVKAAGGTINLTDSDDAEMAEAWEKPADVGHPGTLKRIVLETFMCHEHFKMEFGPNVNFISGQNGSGKSAVLQATQQVLGVKARDTGRASSQASFIKEGCPEARIIITLWNEGPAAYQPNVFGKEICIERRIGKSASYTIKDWRGRKVGSKREDLDDILTNLNINAANPIAVMTQDTTRSFMDGGSGKRDRAKYEIYQEATMLARIEEANVASQAQVRQMGVQVQSQKDKHKALHQKFREVEKAVESLKEIDKAKEEEVQLQNALAWASVASDQAELESLEVKLTETGPKAQETLAVEVQEAMDNLARLQEAESVQRDDIANHHTKREERNAEIKEAMEELTAARVNVRKAEQAVRKATAKRDEYQQKQQELMEVAKETQAELYEENQAAIHEHQAKINEMEARHLIAQEKLKEAAKALRAYNNEGVRLINVAQDAQEQLRHTRRRVENAEAELRDCEQAAKNGIHKFGGQQTVKLVAAIKANMHRFHKPPIGPIGHVLALKDARWAVPVELHTSYLLDSFVVNDQHDLNQLKELCRTIKCRIPQVVLYKFNMPLHKVQSGVPPSHVLTMLHVLRVSDSSIETVVLNTFIDQGTIERQALALTDEDAKQAAYSTRNVMGAFTQDGTKRAKRGCNETVYFNNQRNRHWRLGSSVQDSMPSLQQELRAAKAECEETKQAVREAEDNISHHRAQRGSFIIKFREASSHKRKLDEEKRELLENSASQAQAYNLSEDESSELQLDLQQVAQDLAEAGCMLVDAELNLEKAKRTEQLAGEKEATARQNMQDLEEYNLRLLTAEQERVEALETAQEKVETLTAFSVDMECRLAMLADTKEQALAIQQDHIAKATQVCSKEEGEAALAAIKQAYEDAKTKPEDIPVMLEPTFLAKKLEKLQKKIRQQEAEAGGMREEVEMRHRKMEREVNKSRRQLAGIVDAYKLLHMGIEARLATYKRMEHMVEQDVNNRFNFYMHKKGHLGSIKVNQEEGALEIKVCIDGSSNKGKGKVKDLKQLSGGERSFTTVAFSLALGEYTSCPFRAMDEFDVFMDAINRTISLESLLTNALEQRHLQFIFLTPLDISAVELAKAKMREKGIEVPDDFVKVVCMRPARNTAATQG